MHTLKHLVMFTALLLFSVSALAHIHLKNSVPNANAQLTQAPKTIALSFEKDVHLMKVVLVDASGKSIVLPSSSMKMSTEQIVLLPTLGVGAYTLTWVSMAADGHNMPGTISFNIVAEQTQASSSVSTQVK